MKNALEMAATCDLHDAQPDKVRHVGIPFCDYGGRTMFAGRIRTVVTMHDTKLIQEALFCTPGEGGVIVLDGGGSVRSALLGDVNAHLLV